MGSCVSTRQAASVESPAPDQRAPTTKGVASKKGVDYEREFIYDEQLLKLIKAVFKRQRSKSSTTTIEDTQANANDSNQNANQNAKSSGSVNANGNANLSLNASTNQNSKSSSSINSNQNANQNSNQNLHPERNEWRDKIMDLFKSFDDWEFDTIQMAKLTAGKPLLYIAYACLCKFDLFKRLNIREQRVVNFLVKVQDYYFNNPFHNCTHAADCVWAIHAMIRRGLNQYISDEDIFACIIAASIIDIRHPSLDNNYMENTQSYCSTIYNGISILEYNSCAQAFFLIRTDTNCDFFEGMSREMKADIRESIILMVLNTDPSKHDTLLSSFKTKLEKGDFSDRNESRLLLQIAMRIADLSYCCMRPLNIYHHWLRKLLDEQYTQTDLVLSQSSQEIIKEYEPLMQRPKSKEDIAAFGKQEYSFLQKSVKPLINSFLELISKFKSSKTFVHLNRKYWDYYLKTLDGSSSSEEKPSSSFASTVEEFDQFKHSGAEKNYETLNQEIMNREIPDQDKVIPLDEQEKKRRVQNDHEKQLEQECLDKLISRFDKFNEDIVNNPEEVRKNPIWKTRPFEEQARIYCLKDFDELQSTLSDDEVRNSVIKMFDRIDDWNFDVFALTELLKGESMFLTSYILFTKYDLLNKFHIEHDLLVNFLKAVQEGYQMNPYHNAMHACDVMQITNSIMVKGGMLGYLDDIDLLAAIISSMVHDYDHPGLNNAFQSHSGSYLATLYNDRSILENHHCAQTFRIMRESDGKCNIFKNMKREQQVDARKTMVGMVLSTDMSNHASYIQKFNSRIEAESDFRNKEDIRLALQIAIKMADVSNPARPLYLYLQWTQNIITEFFLQGDKERENGLPVSPLMDRHTSVLSKGQIAFMQYIIIPMFKSFQTVFPEMKFADRHIEENREYWNNHSEILVEDMKPGENMDIHLKD